ELKDRPPGNDEADRLVDGAIFAFAQGTDPEILLVLEARSEKGKPIWQYALARFSDLPLVVKHKDTEVWRVPTSTMNDGRAPYFARDVEQRSIPKENIPKENGASITVKPKAGQ